MFLSIVIPIWNDEKYLEECLDSCLDQAISKDEYEIICVDDGSTDKTPEILRFYEKRYANIHVIFAEHQGGGRGRDTGLSIAKGKFVWFVDHDDFIAPHAVDTLFTAFKNSPGIERFRFQYYEFFNELNEQEQSLYKCNALKSNSHGLEDTALWPSIFLIDFLRRNGITAVSSRINEAKLFWRKTTFPIWGSDAIFVSECLDCGIKTAVLSCGPLYFYRRSECSETMSKDQEIIRKRELGIYNSALVNAYLAIKAKKQYYYEREESDQASFETTRRAIIYIRTTVSHFANLSSNNWKLGIALMREQEVFFDKRPPEYTYRFVDYWKSLARKKKMSPKSIAYYYSFLYAGALWYRLWGSSHRILRKNEHLLSLRRKGHRIMLQKSGMDQ